MATARKQSRSRVADVFPGVSMPVALILAALVVGLAALLPLVQSSGATSTAGSVRELEQAKSDLRAKLRTLELEVAQRGSLDRIQEEAARRFNFGPPKQTIYLPLDVPAPEPRRLPNRYLPRDTEPKQDDKSLWDRAFGWISTP